MTRAALLRSWMISPPLNGKWLVLWTAVALPIAALLDSTMDCPDRFGECCTPFFLFVLLTSLLFGWSAGIISACASAAADDLLNAVRHLPSMPMPTGANEILGTVLFLMTCAGLIAAVELVCRMLNRFSRLPNEHEYSSGIIFSLEKGHAWASWPGNPVPVRLGPQQEVGAMMKDFLAQIELARRLGGSAGSALGSVSMTPLKG